MDPASGSTARPARLDLALAGGLWLSCWLVYAATLTPSLSYVSPDGNELATIPVVLGLAHPPGYPLYTWLGWLFSLVPVGDAAHRINLMSATLGAAAVGCLYLLSLQLLPPRLACRRAAALLSALLFAFGPTVWSQAVIAEVYAPNLAFVALTLLCLLRWERTRRDRDFFLFAVVFGLSLGMHLSDLGFAPALAVFVLLTDWRVLRRPRWWAAGLAGFGLGAAQFLWIPLQAHQTDPHLLLGRVPDGLAGLYAYTLGSFSELKFAFPLGALPERLVVYLYLLRQELGRLAIVVGVGGLASLLVRRPRHYFLLVGMYLVHVWFFIQYKVFDLEVFFLPAHFLWAIFVSFGAAETLTGLRALLTRLKPGSRVPVALQGIAAGAVLILAVVPMASRWREADRSEDVAVNDFYANAWELLPEGSALLTRTGVFGYDALYWRLAYGTRPDVRLPVSPSEKAAPPKLDAGATYSTVSRATLQRAPRAMQGADARIREAWMVPVLVGEQAEGGNSTRWDAAGRLTLYRLESRVPSLVVECATPPIVIGWTIGGATLVGADVSPAAVESGGRVHVVLYWRVAGRPMPEVSIGLDGDALEQHEIGFGNLARYEVEVGPVAGRVIVEDFWLVIPSTASAGEHALTVGMAGRQETVEIQRLTVVDEEGRFERWLSVAG